MRRAVRPARAKRCDLWRRRRRGGGGPAALPAAANAASGSLRRMRRSRPTRRAGMIPARSLRRIVIGDTGKSAAASSGVRYSSAMPVPLDILSRSDLPRQDISCSPARRTPSESAPLRCAGAGVESCNSRRLLPAARQSRLRRRRTHVTDPQRRRTREPAGTSAPPGNVARRGERREPAAGVRADPMSEDGADPMSEDDGGRPGSPGRRRPRGYSTTRSSRWTTSSSDL